MATFVLIHGAFRGGWAWRQVRGHLIAAGHDVYAPSLIGAGELADLIEQVDGLDVWVDQITSLITLEDLEDVVLVGHSQGGLVTTSVAARIPDRIAALVHLDAAVPAAGERAIDLSGVPDPLPPRAGVVPPGPAATPWLAARLTPSPVAVALDPVPGVPVEVTEHYIFFSDTPAGYPAAAVRARLAAEARPFRLIQADHDAPSSDPDVVAALLLEYADGLNRTEPTKGHSA